MRRLLLVCVVSWSTVAWSFEEGARREEVDAGVHVPVLTKSPELVSSVPAVYPPEAEAEGRTADVTLVLTLDAEGKVAEATVPNQVGFGFDEAAIDAVKQFQFTPAEVDGVPAPVQLEYVYHFTLTAPAPPPEAEVPKPTATLQGVLVARGSRTKIEAGTVRCGTAVDAPEVLSDEEGRFSLTVEPGPCAVSVVANGFVTFKTDETLNAGETTEVVYHVVPKAQGFESVVRGDREKKEVVKRTLERSELQKIPGSFGDPVRVLQNFPGVARAPFISGALIVRGASPDQTLTFLDGVEIPLLFHLGGGPSVVNGEFLDRIDFFPGGFGGRYGRAVGGAVDVATRKGATDTLHGVLKVDLQDSSLYFEAPVGKDTSVAAAVRRSYVDALIPLVLPKDPEGGTILVLPRYWDYQVRADKGAKRSQISSDGASSYSVMAFGSDDVLKVVATGGGRNRDVSIDLHTLFHRLVGNWTYRKGDVTFALTPYLGYDLGTFGFGEVKFRADEYEAGLREDLSVALSPWATIRTGFDILYDHQAGEAELPVLSGTQYVGFPGAEPKTELQKISREFESFDAAAFAELDFKLGPLTLTPGLRASTAFLNGETRHALEPRFWARWQLFERTAIKGSVGLYQQPPQAADLEKAPLGNPNLVHEKAFQSSLGIEQRFTDALHIDVTGFFNRRYQNVVQPGRTILNDDGTITSELSSNDGLGRAYGLEVLARHDVTKSFFGWIAYTWNRSQERRAGGDPYRLTSYDQTHILTVVASYKLPWNLELGGRFRYVTGRPTTPLQHEQDLYNADNNRFAATLGPVRSARLKPFHQLDLRLEKSFLFDSWTLSAYLDVQNVYNQQNVEATFYDYRFREEFEVPGIPILPILGVKGSF